jgi:hypothetical protein
MYNYLKEFAKKVFENSDFRASYAEIVSAIIISSFVIADGGRQKVITKLPETAHEIVERGRALREAVKAAEFLAKAAEKAAEIQTNNTT